MCDFRTMYYTLSAKVADAIDLLTEAQQEAERLHSKEENSTITTNMSENLKRIDIPRRHA